MEELTITKQDVKRLVEIIPILDALDEGVSLIGGEKYATGSATLPFLVKFQKLLVFDEEDPLYLSKFKEILREDLKERCDINLNKRLLAKASFFDKRFASLKFLDNELFMEEVNHVKVKLFSKEDIVREIKEELRELEDELQNNREHPEVEPEAPLYNIVLVYRGGGGQKSPPGGKFW